MERPNGSSSLSPFKLDEKIFFASPFLLVKMVHFPSLTPSSFWKKSLFRKS